MLVVTNTKYSGKALSIGLTGETIKFDESGSCQVSNEVADVLGSLPGFQVSHVQEEVAPEVTEVRRRVGRPKTSTSTE